MEKRKRTTALLHLSKDKTPGEACIEVLEESGQGQEMGLNRKHYIAIGLAITLVAVVVTVAIAVPVSNSRSRKDGSSASRDLAVQYMSETPLIDG